MNYHKRVLWFVVIITVSLFSLSLITAVFDIEWKPIKNISILADIIKKKSTKKVATVVEEPSTNPHDSLSKHFVDFDLPNKVTAYYADTNNVVMKNLMKKLLELKQGKRKKIRIAFLGDSMIEDDFISLTLRRLLQQQFGGYGVGYLPMSSELAGARTTANIHSSTNWQEANFRNNPNKSSLFISGRLFSTYGTAWTEIDDKTATPNQPLNKYVLFGKAASSSVVFNNSNTSIIGNESFNSFLLDSSIGNKMKVSVNAGLPVFGISLEAPTGVIVDNFSFRGNSGWEFGKMDSSFLATINKNHPYDLIIMQYGVNLFVKASDEKFDWYYSPMKKAVAKVKTSFSNADILLMGCADRAFRYGNDYQTAVGMPAIIAMQQKIAYEGGIAFYNTFSSMGGEGSMVKWVNDKPSLAYKDYMHPNDKGSEVLGKSMYDAIMYEYQKYTSKKK